MNHNNNNDDNSANISSDSLFSKKYLSEVLAIIESLDHQEIEKMAHGLAKCREEKGRLFILGVGGSASHASHAVNDFRKICSLEAYTPTDNVSELSARINDEGWEHCFVNWLKGSSLNRKDALLVFSVGGGSKEKNISTNLVSSMEYGKEVGAEIYGIVGKDGGFTKKVSNACVIIPPLFSHHITSHTEGICAIIWHLLVSHPALKKAQTTWESIGERKG